MEKSNEHAEIVLQVLAELSHEGAGQLGVDGLDTEISDLGPGIVERERRMSVELLAELKLRLAAETDVKVRQAILKDTVMGEFVPSQMD